MARRRYKTPLAVRKKQALARKKFKVPMLTGAAIAVPAMKSWNFAKDRATIPEKVKFFAVDTIENFTGLQFDANTGKFLKFKAPVGLLTLGAVTFAKRMGIFRGANQALAQSRIPVRLS